MYRNLLVFLLAISWGFAQERPGWVKPEVRASKYPEISHFIGFSTRYFEKGEDLNEVKEKVISQARTALSESIHINITSQATSQLKNLDQEASESYSKIILTSSNLRTGGLSTQVYLDEKQGTAYALASVTRKKLLASYFLLLSEQMDEVKNALERAAAISDKAKAYTKYLAIIRTLENLKSVQHMLRTLGTTSDIVLKKAEWNKYYSQADQAAEALRNTDEINLGEAARFLADKLIQELDDRSATIVIGSITFKSSGMGSELSDRLRHLVIESFKEQDLKIRESALRGGTQYFLSGNYFPGNSKVQVSAEIKEMYDQESIRLIAGSTVFIPRKIIDEEGIGMEPNNYASAKSTTKTLDSAQRTDDGLAVEFWTNKAGDAQTFKEGESLSISLRVNRPSSVRLFNVWQDGTIVLLLDNYYVPASKVNRVIDVSEEFVTQCPCGVEYLKVMAQTEPFMELETYEQDGFEFVEETLRSALEKSRGFSKKKDAEYGFAEQMITVTTLAQ